MKRDSRCHMQQHMAVWHSRRPRSTKHGRLWLGRYQLAHARHGSLEVELDWPGISDQAIDWHWVGAVLLSACRASQEGRAYPLACACWVMMGPISRYLTPGLTTAIAFSKHCSAHTPNQQGMANASSLIKCDQQCHRQELRHSLSSLCMCPPAVTSTYMQQRSVSSLCRPCGPAEHCRQTRHAPSLPDTWQIPCGCFANASGKMNAN